MGQATSNTSSASLLSVQVPTEGVAPPQALGQHAWPMRLGEMALPLDVLAPALLREAVEADADVGRLPGVGLGPGLACNAGAVPACNVQGLLWGGEGGAAHACIWCGGSGACLAVVGGPGTASGYEAGMREGPHTP